MLATLVDYARQLDAPQLSHLVSAGICLYFGVKGTPRERVFLWGVCALLYALVGWAGYRWGAYDWPTSYRVENPEPFLYKPLPGVELREIDHVLQLLLAYGFGAGALATAWAEGLFGRAAAATAALLPSRDAGASGRPSGLWDRRTRSEGGSAGPERAAP